MAFCQGVCNWVCQPPLQLRGVGIYSHGCKQGCFQPPPLADREPIAIRAFWKHARKAEAVGLLGTDAQMRQHGLNAHFRHPDGRSVHNVLPKDRSRTRATYWVRLIKPWLAALVAPDGYSITMTKHFERVRMHYWGAVAKR